MFGSLKERLESVRHDVTLGWKTISDKAKAVNQKIARKTTFITEEYTEGQDQCFNCDLEAGSEILEQYHKDWADIHEKSRASAEEAEPEMKEIRQLIAICKTRRGKVVTAMHACLDRMPHLLEKNATTFTLLCSRMTNNFRNTPDLEYYRIPDCCGFLPSQTIHACIAVAICPQASSKFSADQAINSILKKCTNLRNTMTIFHGELEKLPEVIENIETATKTIASIGTESEMLEDLLMDLEEVCEKLDIERHKNSHRLKVVMLHQSKLDDLEKLKEDLQLQYQLDSQKKERLERQESLERQKVYEDAFIEQMNYYIQFGKTDEHVSHSFEPEESLADIKLEDYDLEKQLDDFLGPSIQEDPSIPSKAPDRSKHKRKSPKSKSKTKQTETKAKGKSKEEAEVTAASTKEESTNAASTSTEEIKPNKEEESTETKLPEEPTEV